MTWSKWPGAEGEFLVGREDENFQRLVPKDLEALKQVLDWTEKYHIKVVLTPVSLPGACWRQNNGGKFDKRLWQDAKYRELAAKYWRELAGALKDHPAVVGYDILNEPAPERATGLGDEYEADLAAFYDKYKASAADVNRFNQTNSYAGDVPLTEKQTVRWDRPAIAAQFDGITKWTRANHVPANRILVGEFGCDRRVAGCAQLFADTLAELNARGWHWAVYAFREDERDAMDDELGERRLPWTYWQAVERGEDGEAHKPRGSNPIWDVLAREFSRNGHARAE